VATNNASDPLARRFTSLEGKLMVPMLVASAFVLVIYALTQWAVHEHRREMLLLNKATLIAESVSRFPRDADVAALQLFVHGFAEVDEEVLVVVARGDPLRVFASSYLPWRGLAVSELATVDASAAAFANIPEIQHALTAGTTTLNAPLQRGARVDDAFESTAPFGNDGMVVACVGWSEPLTTVVTTTALLAAVTLAGLAGVAFTSIVVVRRRVLEPLTALTAGVGEVATMRFPAATDVTADELSILADTVHASRVGLQRSMQRQKLIVESAELSTWEWDCVSGELIVNDRWAEAVGCTVAELAPRIATWVRFVHPEDVDRTITALNSHLEGTTEFFRVEHRLVALNGTILWVVNAGKVSERDPSGKPQRMAGINLDITERKLAESARQHLASIVEHSEDAIIGLTLDGTILSCNAAATRMFMLTAEQLIGQQEQRFIPTREGQIERVAFARIAKGERVEGYESIHLLPDGTRFEVSVALSAVRDERGLITGVAKIVRDISERREKVQLQAANELLALQNHRLEDLTERAHRFVDDVSHEFRTPLTVIKEYASLVSDGLGGAVTTQQSEWLEVIEGAAVDLNQLVEDFLDSSKLRTGRLRVDRRACSVKEIAHAAHSMISGKAAARHITVVQKIAPGLPLIFADEEKVRRILLNLLSNALKFSPEGSSVVLGAGLTAGGDVEFSVIDQGPGLVATAREQLFERFQTLPSALSPAVKGFGLGLNIVQQLVWLNLGSVRVESEVGHGACFSFTVPTCDAGHIMKRFFERIAEQEEPPQFIALLRFGVTGADANQIEVTRRCLVASTRPCDVVMVAKDGCSLVVFGPTGNVNEWRTRLAECAVARNHNKGEWGGGGNGVASSEPIVVPEIEVLGCWRYPANESSARVAIRALTVSDHPKNYVA
jgi:PAS domain S-box-containing protein